MFYSKAFWLLICCIVKTHRHSSVTRKWSESRCIVYSRILQSDSKEVNQIFFLSLHAINTYTSPKTIFLYHSIFSQRLPVFCIFLARRCSCSETEDMPRVCVWLPLEQTPLAQLCVYVLINWHLGCQRSGTAMGSSWIQRLTRAAVYLFRASYGIEGEVGWECRGRVTNMKVNMMYNWHIPDIS